MGGGSGLAATGNSPNNSHVTSDSGVAPEGMHAGEEEKEMGADVGSSSMKPPVLSPMMDSYITQQHRLSQGKNYEIVHGQPNILL